MSTAKTLEAGSIAAIEQALGADARRLLDHRSTGVPKESCTCRGADFVDRVFAASDRPVPVLRNLQQLLGHGRLAGTGYVSILPVDQGIEHSAGASFAKNPAYFDPENIVKLAIEGGCNAVASTLGVLGSVARKYAHKIPFLVKFNHNEFISFPNRYDQIAFARVEQAADRAPKRWAPRSTSAPRSRRGRSRRSARRSSTRTSWAWPAASTTSSAAAGSPRSASRS